MYRKLHLSLFVCAFALVPGSGATGGRCRGAGRQFRDGKVGLMRWNVIAAMAAILTMGCGPREPTTATAASDQPGEAVATAPPTVTSPAGPAAGDQKAAAVTAGESRYLEEALQQGMGQIELAQSVSQRSASAAVDAVAREIIAAHNRINADLTRIAFARSVTLPNDAAPQLRRTIARLEPFEGVNLDAAWLAEILQTYPELIRLHRSAATTATDMELKQVAVRAEAIFDANLRQAKAAYAQVTGTVPPQKPESGSVPPASAGTAKHGR